MATYQSVCMEAAIATTTMPDTKRALLDAAMKLMLSQGFTATSVEDICSGAGVTKGSFFHYFESKDALGLALAEYFSQRQGEMFRNAPYRQLADPLERVFGRLDFVSAMARNPQMPRSCVMGNLVQELSSTHPEIRDFCAGAFQRVAADFARDLAEARKQYPPVIKFDPESVGRLFLTVVQGSMILSKAAQSATPFQENVEHLREYIAHLFGRNPRG